MNLKTVKKELASVMINIVKYHRPRHICQTVMAIGLALGAQIANAAPEKAICAVEQAIACPPYEECQRALPAAVNLPSLMKLDRPSGTVMTNKEGGEERVSKIIGEAVDEDALMLQGIDGQHAWNMRIELATGHFVLTSAAPDAGYVAFGLCSSKILD